MLLTVCFRAFVVAPGGKLPIGRRGNCSLGKIGGSNCSCRNCTWGKPIVLGLFEQVQGALLLRVLQEQWRQQVSPPS